MRTLAALVVFAFVAVPSESPLRAAPKPTHPDVRYDTKHERNVLDFWQAKSKKPTPLVVHFHGGGFRGGDKQALRRRGEIDRFLDAGVSVAACNYPFLKDASYAEILAHCGRAIQFLRSKSKQWNIDPRRIGAYGGSAGALISEWLAYAPDRGSPSSKDPVGRLSSKVQVAGGFLQPYGTDVMILPRMKKGGPPLFLYSNSPPTDKVHHPRYSKMIFEKARKLKIPVMMYGGGRNDLPKLPKGKNASDVHLEFFFKHLKVETKRAS